MNSNVRGRGRGRGRLSQISSPSKNVVEVTPTTQDQNEPIEITDTLEKVQFAPAPETENVQADGDITPKFVFLAGGMENEYYDDEEFYNPYDDYYGFQDEKEWSTTVPKEDFSNAGGFGGGGGCSVKSNTQSQNRDREYQKAIDRLNATQTKSDNNAQLRNWLDNMSKQTSKRELDNFYHENWRACKSVEANFKQYGQEVRQLLPRQFDELRHPFSFALMVSDISRPFQKGQTTSLAYIVMDELEKWIRKQAPSKNSQLAEMCTQEVKNLAFIQGNRGLPCFMKLVVQVFKLDQPPDNAVFVQQLQPLLEQGKFKEVAQCAAYCNLQEYFDTVKLLFPLIVQDKLVVCEEYLENSPTSVREILSFLDNIVTNYYTERPEQMAIDQGIRDIRLEKLGKSALKKLTTRWMRQFGVDLTPQELCPGVSNSAVIGSITHLLYRRYFEGGVDLHSFRGLLRAEIFSDSASSTIVQVKLVELLCDYQEPREARYWIQEFGWSEEQIPEHLVDVEPADDAENSHVLKKKMGFTVSKGFEGVSTGFLRFEGCLELPFDTDEVQMVDSVHAFVRVIEEMQSCAKLGVDVEWRPAIGGVGVCDNPVALLQLGTERAAWLFDVPMLKRVLSEEDWRMLALLFAADIPLKLGYGVAEDLRQLWRTVPQLQPSAKTGAPALGGFVDLAAPSKALMVSHPNLFVLTDDDSVGVSGLSELCLRTLGLRLDKTEQMSDWETRPLREEQVHYAALDAVCLVMVHDTLEEKASLQPDAPTLSSLGLLPTHELQPTVQKKKSKREKYGMRLRPDKPLTFAAEEEEEEAVVPIPIPIQQEARKPSAVPSMAPFSTPESTLSPLNTKSADADSQAQVQVVVDHMFADLCRLLRSLGISTWILSADDCHLAVARVAGSAILCVLAPTSVPLLSSLLPANRVTVFKDSNYLLQATTVMKRIRYRATSSRCRCCNSSQFLERPPNYTCTNCNQNYVEGENFKVLKMQSRTDEW